MTNRVIMRCTVCCLGVVAAVASLCIGAAPPPQLDIPLDELRPHFASRNRGEAYTFAMLELGMRMGAAGTDALRGKTETAEASLAAFREQYLKVAAMVPSWRSHFPLDPLDDLKRAVAEKQEPSTMQGIIGRIEKSCTSCHVRYMFPVQAYFRWGRFADIQVTDDDNEDVSLHQIMLDMANGLGAIRNDVGNSEFEAARGEYARLKERFTMMELACDACHGEPREYFIDSRVKGRLLKLGGLLRKGSEDVGVYNRLLSEINEMSCFPCHQVHMPAAYLQEYWRENGN